MIKDLWPTPLYMNEIVPSQETIDFALSADYERTSESMRTIDKEILNSLPELKKEIEKEIDKYTRDYLKVDDNIEFYITTSWINKHKPDDYAVVHHHSNSIFSGIYYIRQPRWSGDLLIHENNMTPNISNRVMLNYKEMTDYTTSHYQIPPEDGLLLLFPSFLMHSVEKNKSPHDRYSLGFNVFVKGELGVKESKLSIVK
jgi:uncharacterized protein (TIGR02466 family)